MTCSAWLCPKTATHCARSTLRRKKHHLVCDDHYACARDGKALTLDAIGYAVGLIVPCKQHVWGEDS